MSEGVDPAVVLVAMAWGAFGKDMVGVMVEGVCGVGDVIYAEKLML
jgi:hypothetical protein